MKRQRGIWAVVLTTVAGCAQPGGSGAGDATDAFLPRGAGDPGAQPGGSEAGDATLPIAALSSQSQCGALNRPAVRWIGRSGEWREVYAQVNNQWMDPPPPPTVDFPREGVLLIAMGQRSTAGYGLALADTVATVRDGMLTVRVDWREPPPGRRQAQVMTNPCLLATVPDAGFTRIRVVDRDGQARLVGER